MSRIMQVIDKKTDFTRGTVDLKLYQTNFIGLTKVITSVAGQTVDNAVSGANVGFQFFHDLNTKQLAVRDYVDKYKPKYNAEIATKKKTVTNVIDFSYNWKSCVDYKSQIVEGDKADYRLFQKVVNAEKELYDYRLYAGDHIKRNCEIMASWGMNRNYGSCLKKILSKEIETNGTGDWGWSVVAQGTYVTGSIRYEAKDKRRVFIDNMHLIPVGQTDFVMLSVGGSGRIKAKVTRHSLGTTEDDGYFTGVVDFEIVVNNGAIRKYNGSDSVQERTGKKSPHFAKSSGVYDLEFFKTRKLI
ncbi:MAG: hypothetical protein ACRCX2_11360 [Paraclostridium sp.]